LTILFDFDGTLVSLQPHPDMVKLPDEMKSKMDKLIAYPDVDLCVITGRSLANIRKLVHVNGINLAGSHGMETLLAKEKRIESCPQASFFKSKVPELANELKKSVCLHGGWIEEKVFHVTFHYRETTPAFRQQMIAKAKEIIANYGFQAQNSHFGVEARPPIGWDKGRGSYYILEKLHGITWADNNKVIYLGDDETDEDAMRALAGLGITFRVGKPNVRTFATHRLPNVESVEVFIDWAIDYMSRRDNQRIRMQKKNLGLRKRTSSH
jgi:trehalose-phosphatase